MQIQRGVIPSMRNSFAKQLKIIALAFGALVVVAAILVLCRRHYLQYPADQRVNLHDKCYDSVFVGNYNTPGVDAETVALYFNWDPYVNTGNVDFFSDDFKTITKNTLYRYGNKRRVKNVIFFIDPLILYHSSDTQNYSNNIDKYIGSVVKDNPDVCFRSIFPCHSMEYYRQMGEEQYGDISIAYSAYAEALSGYDNMTFDFQGNQEWIYLNPNMFEDINADKMTKEAGLGLFLQSFTDFFVTPAADVETVADELLARIKNYDTDKYAAPDLSDTNLVVIGDSIFGNYGGKTSIQGALHDLTGMNVYVHAQGGMTASSKLVGEIMGGKLDVASIDEELKSADESSVIFLVEFGLNDFFEQYELDDPANPMNDETFAGGLRKGLGMIKEHYHNAKIIVTAPGYLANEDYFAETEGPLNNTLQAYRDTAKSVAETEEVYFYDLSERVKVNSANYAYYMDTHYDEIFCHYNENGRLLVARALADYINEMRVSQR